MIDFHCHLDLYKDPISIFKQAESRCSFVLAVTTSPRAYLKAQNHFRESHNIKVAIGLHPELVQSRINEAELFLTTLKDCKYVGEIGIDGSDKFRSSFSMQADFFKEALIESERLGGKILSVHSRGATKEVLSIIENYVSLSTPVMHWYTGTTKDVLRALEMGCWFSINPQMCSSKSGMEIVAKIPLSRILPETDGPFTQRQGKPYMPWDDTVIQYLTQYYGISTDTVLQQMHDNIRKINL